MNDSRSDPMPDPLPGWRRLDPRTIAAGTILTAGGLAVAAVPLAIGLLLSGVAPGWVALWTVGGTILGAATAAVSEAVRLAVTRYRVDDHRIDRRVRFLSSTTSSLSTGRVRNVEVSTDLVQRRLGVATVRLSSGETGGPRLTLNALDRAEADALRHRVLARRATAETSQIASWDPGWVRYAPASLMTPLFGVIAVGAVFQVADWFGAVPAMLRWFWDRVDSLPLPAIAAGVVVTALLIGILISVVVFVENWWNLRLDHHRDGSLEIRRGLLVGRHTTFDGRRVRGVTLHEPPGFRALRAARLDVIATGVGTTDGNGNQSTSPALLPASPRGESTRVAESVLGGGVPEPLQAHPPQARRRRALRAALATAALTTTALVPALVWPELWWIPVAVAALSALVTGWIAVDNARGLGHRVGEDAVALRKGSLMRRTDVLTRDGILGWNVRRTPFQRRAGLATLVATSAGGTGAFRLPDVAAAEVRGIAETAGDVWEHLAAD